MYQGKVVEQGLKTEVLSPPFPGLYQLLLSSVPEMDPDWLTDLLKNPGRRSGGSRKFAFLKHHLWKS
ncbi:MAG: hypothetical protein Ct9H90mP8_3420 [Pseudomonadota bacterium]|nr:MAG: hypothetical protein Ct9H90mP8_3420 [Pseudomonadota bacterium]